MSEFTNWLLYTGFIVGLVFTLGWFSNDLYRDWTNDRVVDGFYVANVTYNNLNYYKEQADPMGDFVCVNVRGMDFRYAQQVCSHEVLHHAFSEIYAELCEDNFEGCISKLENDTKQ